MTGRFANFACSNTHSLPVLPVVHTTDWWSFRHIMDGNLLAMQRCPVFSEDLVYLFYGKPCYRLHQGSEPTSLSAFYLVSLIFEANSVGPFRRVHPFDTGAFSKGFYQSHLHPKMEIKDFELNASLGAVTEAVDVFYGTNAGYFKGAPKKNIPVSPMDIEAEAFVSLISTPARTPADDRRSAIEIQLQNSIDLTNVRVLAVILPEQLLDDQRVEQFIEVNLGAEALGYFCPHARPDEDVRAIMTEAKRFYKSRSWLL